MRRALLLAHADGLDFGVRVIVDSALDTRPADAAPDEGFYSMCPFGGALEACDDVHEDCDGIIDEDTAEPRDGAEQAPVMGPSRPTVRRSATARSSRLAVVLLLMGLVGVQRCRARCQA